MLTVGDKLPAFRLTSVVGLEKDKEFQEIGHDTLPRQVAGPVLVADGLHLHLPDRDRRVRPPQPGLRRPRRAGPGRQHRHALRAPGLAQEPPRPDRPAVPDAGRHQARAVERAGRAAQRTACRCGPPSSSTRTGSSATSASTTSRSAATWTRCCACSTRCRPTSCARATGSGRADPGGGVTASNLELHPLVAAARGDRHQAQPRLGAGRRRADRRAALGRGPGRGRDLAQRGPARGDRGRRAARGERGGRRGCAGRRGAHGDEQRLLPVPPHDRQAELLGAAGAPAHEPSGQAGVEQGGLRAVLAGRQRHHRMRVLRASPRAGGARGRADARSTCTTPSASRRWSTPRPSRSSCRPSAPRPPRTPARSAPEEIVTELEKHAWFRRTSAGIGFEGGAAVVSRDRRRGRAPAGPAIPAQCPARFAGMPGSP